MARGNISGSSSKKGTGILTPEIPRGFDDHDPGYPVTMTFIDNDAGAGKKEDFVASDRNVVVVKNPISSTVPSAAVRIELATHAEVVIGSSEEIVVDFSGPSADSEFIVPSSIATSRITIEPDGQSAFNPSEVQVQGAKVTLTIPAGTSPKTVGAGDYTITFTNSARIKNPFSAGNRVITVQSFAEGDKLDEITVVIRRTTTIDPLEGPRGSQFRLEGKGYAKGTVTIYEGDDEIIDPGETLASVETVRGAFRLDLIARGNKESLQYTVRAKDSEGVDSIVTFLIKSAISFNPVPAKVGSLVRITISGWQNLHQEVVAVRIAGRDVFDIKVIEYQECFDYPDAHFPDGDRVISLQVEVPRHVPPGEQTVSLYEHEQLEHFRLIDDVRSLVEDKGACIDLPEGEDWGAPVNSNVKAQLKADPIAITKDTLEIVTQDLQLSPSSAARGESVIITGSGFTPASGGSEHIESVWIGGKRVSEDDFDSVLGTDGDIALKVTVPLNIPDGPNEVRIERSDHSFGQATLTIPEAAITLSPAQGQAGTEYKVSGSGFIARKPVLVTYGPEEGASRESAPLSVSGVLADSQGNFGLILTVPITAEAGKSYRFTAVAETDASEIAPRVDASTSHLVPKAVISTSPESVSPGDRMSIRGQYMPPFALVGPIRMGGVIVALDGAVTDELGSFETKVLVPNLGYGDQLLHIQVEGEVVPHVVRMVPPPPTGEPDQVFKSLIQAGLLLVVWHYNNATQAWTVFDPNVPESMPELNDLKEVASGDIVWIKLQGPHQFQGDNLVSGWNLIELE